MKNNLTNIKSDNINKIDWKLLQNEMKNKFGSEIYDSWLKKIDLVDEFKNYVLLSVSTRFIRDFRNIVGKNGSFQNNFKVYNRENKSCLLPGCKGTIKKKFITNRSTFFCNICQK